MCVLLKKFFRAKSLSSEDNKSSQNSCVPVFGQAAAVKRLKTPQHIDQKRMETEAQTVEPRCLTAAVQM